MNEIYGEYPVTYLGEEAGKLSVTEKGLLTVFSCICRPVSDKVLRLYCRSGGKTVTIGVMTPCSKNLTLSKSYSKNALSDLGLEEIDAAYLSADGGIFTGSAERSHGRPSEKAKEGGVWQPENAPWRLFSDEELAPSCRNIRGALVKFEDDTSYLAVPISPYEPFPPMPIFCFGAQQEIEGRSYIVFKMQNGKFVKQ